jgi:outer membrane protein assembly factor BamB
MAAIRNASLIVLASFTFGGGFFCGLADAEELQYPLAIATHGDAIYLADRSLPGIWKSEGGKLSVYFQGSKTFRTPLNAPRCLAVDSEGRLYAGDSATREVYRFDANGQPQPLTGSSILIPMGIAITAEGELFVSDLQLNRIWKISSVDEKKPTVERFADVEAPTGLCLDGEGRLWVVSRGPQALLRVDSKGNVEPVISNRAFEFPQAVAVDKEGTAFVSDGYGKAVWRVQPQKQPQQWVSGDPLVYPVELAWQDDKLLVVDPRAKSVFRIDRQGEVSTVDLGVISVP